MRDIDPVKVSLAEIGDRDVTAVENEAVSAAEPGQGIVDVAAAVATVENIVVNIAGEIIAELRAEQVSDVGKRVVSRAAGKLQPAVEADGYSGRCMLIARGVT